MDKKKLIGIIIGVLLFAALVAGATYAFLTLSANVSNGVYNGKTINFNVNYTKGTDIASVPQLTTGTPEDAASLVVKASKALGSTGGTITIQLNTTSTDSLTTDGVVNWALCVDECTESGFTDAKATGVVSGSGTLDLYSASLTDDDVSYYVYFWMNSATLTSDHVGKSYSGYISATAVQSE